MFNAEIDKQLHEGFILDTMRIFNVGRSKAEEMVIQMEKNAEEIWNNPEKFYKDLDNLKKEDNE